ncbi:MAG: prepilin-type N-terminal cleavage/methylation domain-containing protein [Magnetococcales bacterium]|nr:prepilin-type N-terminal cleavage/methylation domain-containing protein [Magnetococcales bacterium]
MLTPAPPANASSTGFSLVELLMAMAIGLILFAWMSDYMTRVLVDHSATLQRNHLDQAFQTTLGLMDRDLRRAGFWGAADSGLGGGPSNPFGAAPHRINTGNLAGEPANSCLTFSYDLNLNGQLDQAAPDERFGFRLNRGVVEMRTGGSAPLDCNSGQWTALTDASATIDALTFNLTGVYCLNLSRAGVDCAAVTPLSGDRLLRQYRVDLLLGGRLSAQAAFQRSDALSVLVRNPVVETLP